MSSLSSVSLCFALAAAPLAAQCGHFEAVPVPAEVQTFGKQVCTSGLDLGEWGRLLYQKHCPLRVVVIAARNRASSTRNETDVDVERMVPVLTFRPACLRTAYRLAWIETCAAGAPVTVSAMPSFKTVACR
jgi:hypothetical protein